MASLSLLPPLDHSILCMGKCYVAKAEAPPPERARLNLQKKKKIVDKIYQFCDMKIAELVSSIMYVSCFDFCEVRMCGLKL